MLEIIVAFVAGAVVMGFIANRRPGWFASLVALTNAVDAKVNATVANTVNNVTGTTTSKRK